MAQFRLYCFALRSTLTPIPSELLLQLHPTLAKTTWREHCAWESIRDFQSRCPRWRKQVIGNFIDSLSFPLISFLSRFSRILLSHLYKSLIIAVL